MTASALRPAPRGLRRRRLPHRHHRRFPFDPLLVSVAGAADARVRDREARSVGVLEDVLADPAGEPYLPVAGLMVHVRHKLVFVPADAVADLRPHVVELASSLESSATPRPPDLSRSPTTSSTGRSSTWMVRTSSASPTSCWGRTGRASASSASTSASVHCSGGSGLCPGGDEFLPGGSTTGLSWPPSRSAAPVAAPRSCA
jgi:hypothetical protein